MIRNKFNNSYFENPLIIWWNLVLFFCHTIKIKHIWDREMDSNEQALLFDQNITRQLQQNKALQSIRKTILLNCLKFDRA